MPRPRPTTTKRCPDCKEVKLVGEFHVSEKYDGGYSPYCKACSRARSNKRWVENGEHMREQARGYYHAHKSDNAEYNRQHSLTYAARIKAENPAKWRAKKFFDGWRQNVASDLTRPYLEELFKTTTHCQCCGKALMLDYEPRTSRKFRSNPAAPSVDRVNNRKGYTRANIAIICWECNFRKTDLTLEDLEMLAAYVKKHGEF